MHKTDSVKRGMVVTYHSNLCESRLWCFVVSGRAGKVFVAGGGVNVLAYIDRTPLGMMEGGYAVQRSGLRVHGEDGECLYEHS